MASIIEQIYLIRLQILYIVPQHIFILSKTLLTVIAFGVYRLDLESHSHFDKRHVIISIKKSHG